MYCALFVFYFNFYVGVLRTISFLLSLLLWCFAHTLVFSHYLICTFTITWVFCALFVFNFHYYVGILRTICFLLINTWVFCALFVFCFYYYVGVLRIICFLLSLIRWCFAHYLFSTFTIALVFCYYLFSTFTITMVSCALFVLYFNYYVGVLRTISFLL